MEEWLSYRLGDFLMFSGRTYWRLFQLQNAALWPLPVVVPAAGCAALLVLLRRPGAGLRMSPHFFNTDEEIEEALNILAELIKR